MNAASQLETVNFHGDELSVVIGPSGEHLVAMRPICEYLGLQWEAQLKRIRRHEVLKTCVSIMDMQMPGDDQRRGIVCLPLEYLNGWLFGVDASRVKKEIRPKVIEYQRECFQVLHDHFHGGGHAKSAMQALGEAIALMEADKRVASLSGMALARWKKIRKEHIKAIETATRHAQLLLGF